MFPPLTCFALLVVVWAADFTALASPHTHPPNEDDPFNILRAVDAHAVAERNAERAISLADARAREAEKRAAAADVAAEASRDMALHFQIESNSRLARVQVLEEERDRLTQLLGIAVLEKEALMVRERRQKQHCTFEFIESAARSKS
jgi:hypothetical protein